MYSAIDFLEENPDVQGLEPLAYACWLDVNTQATRHTQRSGYEELHNIARPHEEEVYANWRSDNRRHVTSGPLTRFTTMMTRIINYSSMPISDAKLPEKFKEAIGSNPFIDLSQRYGFDEFRFKCLIPFSLEDPNGIVVEVPVDPSDKYNPIVNVKRSRQIEYQSRLIPFSRIKHLPTDEKPVLVWAAEMEQMVKKGKKEEYHPVYFAMDREAYYLYTPYLNPKKTIEYNYQLWYTHNTGELLFTKVIGRQRRRRLDRKDPHSSTIKYMDSYISDALPYFDEAIVRLSQDQVNMARHLDPKMWVNGDLQCPECGGAKTVPNKVAGFPLGGQKVPERKTCPSCGGQGQLTNIGPFSTIKLRGGHHNGDKTPSVPAGYITPPTAGLSISNKSWQDWIEMGISTLCIDPIDGRGEGESGYKAEMRLQPKEDLIKEFGDDFQRMTEEISNNKLLLIQGKEAKKIHLSRPLNYSAMTNGELRKQYEEAPLSLKHEKFVQWISGEYRGDKKKIKALTLASCYAPLMHYSESEIDTALNTVYDGQDLIRRDNAVKAFMALCEKYEDKNYNDGRWSELADEWMEENGKFKQEGGQLPEVGDIEVDQPVNGAPLNVEDLEKEIRSNKIFQNVSGFNAVERIKRNLREGDIDKAEAVRSIRLFGLSNEAAEYMLIGEEEGVDPASENNEQNLEDLDDGQVAPNDEPINFGESRTEQIKNVYAALVQDRISREIAVEKIAELTEKPKSEVEAALQKIGA